MTKHSLAIPLGCLMIGACPPDLTEGESFNATLVGCWDGGATYADVWVEGDYAFLGHFGSAVVDVIDVSDPSQPFRVVEYILPFPNQDALLRMRILDHQANQSTMMKTEEHN